MTCGIIYTPVNDTSIINETSRVNTFVRRGVWVFAGGIADAGKDLIGVIGENALMIVALVLNMMITGFFVKQFGIRSGFVFLLIWGVMLTIFGSWGFNMFTGIFVAGILLWIGMIMFPYRRGP
jgi:hypothetical protein